MTLFLTATCWTPQTTHDNTATVPKSICGRSTSPPSPFAIHRMSCLLPSLILQRQRIIVPPVAGFNYSHDAKAQAVAAITSSITEKYGSANLQTHCLPVALCERTLCDKDLGNKLLIPIFFIFQMGLRGTEEWKANLCLALHCFMDHFVFWGIISHVGSGEKT